MITALCTLTKIVALTVILINDMHAIKEMNCTEALHYVSACYKSCYHVKNPVEIDLHCLFNSRESVLLKKYIADNNFVSDKFSSIRHLSKYTKLRSALFVLTINIRQQDLQSVAKLSRIKRDIYPAYYALHDVLNNENAVTVLRFATKCELLVFDEVVSLLSVKYTDNEIQSLIDKAYSNGVK